MNGPELLRIVQGLVAARLVAEESPGEFAFRHVLTRDAVYASLLLRERREHHRTIAEVIEQQYADSIDGHLSELAYHYFEAGAWDKALDYSRRAGEKAQAMYAPREASEQFTRALQAAAKLSPAPALSTLYSARGQAYELLGEFERANADQRAALDSARAAGDRAGEWRAVLDLGFLWASRSYDRSGEYFREALSLARSQNDPALLAQSLNRLGNWYVNLDKPRQALPYHEEALEIFRKLDDTRGTAETLDLLGLTNSIAGDLGRGGDCFRQAVELFRGLDDRRGLSSALANLSESGIVFYRELSGPTRARPGEALQAAQEGQRLAREIGWRAGEAYALCIVADLQGTRGDFGEALALLRSAISLAEEIDHPQWVALGRQILGVLQAYVDDLDGARENASAALKLAREVDSVIFIRHGIGYLAEIEILAGRLDAAQGVLDSEPDPTAEIQSLGQAMCLCARGDLALARGDPSLALEIAKRLDASWPAPGSPRVCKLRGEALMGLGRLEEAESALEAALHALTVEPAPPLEWQYRLALGKVYQLLQKREQAQAEFQSARSVAGQFGLTIPEEKVRTRFQAWVNAQILSGMD